MKHSTITFGEFITNTRTKRGLSQKHVAKLVGISPQYMNDIEQGHRKPKSYDIIYPLAKALEIDMDVLYFYLGRFTPDMVLLEYSESTILAAFKAMRKILGHAPEIQQD